MSIPSSEIHHSLPPRPKFPLGEPPTHPLSYQRPPDDNGRQHSAGGQPSHARPSLDKTDTLSSTAVTSIRKRSSDHVRVNQGGKRVRRSEEEGVDEGTRVVMGAMEDDTPLKSRDAPPNHHAIPPSPTSPIDVFTVTFSDTQHHSDYPLAFLRERDNSKYHMSFSTENNPPPTPRTIPVTSTHSTEMTKVLEFLTSPAQNVQQCALGLPNSLSLNQKQALADLKRKMSTMEEEAASSIQKMSGLEKDLSTTSEKYNKLKIGHEKWKVEIIKSFNRKLEVAEEGHKSVIETVKRESAVENEKKVKELEDQHTTEMEKKVKQMEDRHTSEIDKIIEEIHAERDSQEEKRKKELNCSFVKRVDEMKKQHRQETERDIESLTAQWDLKLENQKEEVKGWRDQAEDLLSERDRYREERDVPEKVRDTYRRERDQSSKEKEALSKEKSELEALLETCQQKNQASQKQLIEMKSTVNSMEGEVYCLDLDKEDLQHQLQARNTEIDDLMAHQISLEGRSATLNKENTTLLSALQTLSTQSELLLASETSLKAELEQQKMSTQLLQARLDHVHTNKEPSQLASLTSDYRSTEAQIVTLELELESSRSEVCKNDSIIGSLTDQVLLLTDEKYELQNQLGALTLTKVQAESLSLAKSKLETQLAALAHGKQQLQDTYDKLVLERAELQARLSESTVKNGDLVKQVETLSSKQVELESQISASKTLCEESSTIRQQLEENIFVSKQEAEEARLSLIESLELKKGLAKDKQALEEEVAGLKVDINNLEARLSQAPIPVRGTARSSEELESLRKDRSRLRLLEEEREGFWTQINDLKEQIERLQNQLRVHEDEEEDEETEDRIAEMRDSYAELQDSHGELRRSYTTLEETHNELIHSSTELQNTVKEMKVEQESLTAEIRSLTHRNLSLEKELKTSRKSCQDPKKGMGTRPLSTVKLPPTKLEKRLEISEQRVVNLRLEVAAKEDELEKAKDLRKCLNDRINALDRSNKDKDRRLEIFKNKLKSSGEDKWRLEAEEKDRIIECLNGKTRELCSEIEKLKNTLKERECQIDTLNGRLIEFQSSLQQMIPAFNQMTKNQMDNLIKHFSSGSPTSPAGTPTSKPRLASRGQLGDTTLFDIRESQEKLSSIRRDIYQVVSTRSKRLENLMIDHHRMGNSIGYNVAMRDYDHCA
ncbi:hypothetical protein I302_103419 [Kwoniella bestiolae CBS 10118]|uniref:Uncharacterized protein n=1 Tax=Kwoniella bestiolae CBS 10118 TaxID=1296100 RepID=A0A1B9G8C4_9TREE|nr:hypothetical protein I302_02119 [Kwoniella bestiolae CBS 10118]OCF27278.1 hypothetical protein I302_02119 [Kwoniella bestiolae CBS 10118]